MDFNTFKDQALLGLCSLLVLLIGFLGNMLIHILGEIKNSMIELNSKIAVIIEKTENHEKRLDKLEERL